MTRRRAPTFKPAIISLCRVYHVGSFQPTDKGYDSYEGAGLSVSLHPSAWAQIARLGDGPLWMLIKPSAAFLDYHAMTAADRTAMNHWGLSEKLVEPTTAYRLTWTDEETDQNMWSTFLDRDDAESELEELLDSDIAAAVTPIVDHLAGTLKLMDRCRQTRPDPDPDPSQLLATLWAEDALRLDGVWWADQYEPTMLSAPRGVIAPSRLGSWSRQPTSEWPDADL